MFLFHFCASNVALKAKQNEKKQRKHRFFLYKRGKKHALND